MSKAQKEATDIAMALIAVATECEWTHKVNGYFRSAHEGYAILKEEVDELWDAVRADDLDHAAMEAVQVAAMAIRFICDLAPHVSAQYLGSKDYVEGEMAMPDSIVALNEIMKRSNATLEAQKRVM